MKFVVDMYYFRAALAAVKTHASKDKEDTVGHSLTLSLQPNGDLLVFAENGLTTGMARVEVDKDEWDGELGEFSLTPDIASTIIAAFTPSKTDWEVQLEISVSFTVERRPEEKDIQVATITIRRLGQLFGGDTYRVSTPVQYRQDLQKSWHMLATYVQAKTSKLPPIEFDSKTLGAFKAAETVYGVGCALASAGSGKILVMVGSRFIGLMYVSKLELDNEADKNFRTTKRAWIDHVPMHLAAAS
ncbi:hypothetical protein FQA45_00200 [Glutamicibacter halophytocola]|uniref:Uncharacterized protein n=1 Tax=Glutamicibacter halophytocola TaxID=1933880 RepID=A0ABX5Y7M5_9MICC|nr:hypothetical protein [Glutamicibacter halophytocola]QDY64856.1 hypothetical protein FQA45_00200 [Glutamicibacter halophytocola]